jgi:hypothetical protein
MIKPPILRLDHRLLHCRRDVMEGCPVEPPPAGIGPQLVNHFTVAIKKERIRFVVGLSDLFKRRHPQSLPAEKNE